MARVLNPAGKKFLVLEIWRSRDEDEGRGRTRKLPSPSLYAMKPSGGELLLGRVEVADVGQDEGEGAGGDAEPRGHLGEELVATRGGDEAAAAGVERVDFGAPTSGFTARLG